MFYQTFVYERQTDFELFCSLYVAGSRILSLTEIPEDKTYALKYPFGVLISEMRETQKYYRTNGIANSGSILERVISAAEALVFQFFKTTMLFFS